MIIYFEDAELYSVDANRVHPLCTYTVHELADTLQNPKIMLVVQPNVSTPLLDLIVQMIYLLFSCRLESVKKRMFSF